MYGTPTNATQSSFILNTGSFASNDYRYIDLGQIASLINRRMYRQGMIYPFSLELMTGTVVNPGYRVKMSIQTLPNTWLLRKAWAFSKEAFLAATKEQREMLKVAKWNDFKVWWDEQHTTSGNMLPTLYKADGTTINVDTGWEYTEVPRHDIGTSYYAFKFFGDTSTTHLGILDEFQKSQQGTVAAPDPVGTGTDMPYDEILVQLDDEDIRALQERNEFPPYDEEFHQYHIPEYFLGSQYNAAASALPHAEPLPTSTPIMLAPCGLIKLQNISIDQGGNGTDISGISIKVNLLAGKYRGLEASSMA
jgi:hypothetical protein